MKCVDCQFNLLCHAGRLDSWSKEKMSIVQLCPVCNRLSVGFDKTLYLFSCELRTFTDEHLAMFKRMRDAGDTTMASAAQMRDPGPGLIGKLSLGCCVACLDALPPQMRSITIKYLDTQTEETLAERVRQQYDEAVPAEEDQIE
jgi:hypothetical protein